MSFHRRCYLRYFATALLSIFSITSMAAAQWPEMLAKTPESPNSMMIFDVAKLRNYANSAKNAEAAKIKEVLNQVSEEFSNSINKVAVVSSIDLNAMDPTWELGLIEFKEMPTLEDIARIEGGYIEEIGGRKVVYSERNGYLIPTKDPSKLATVKPANRQLVKRWLKLVETNQAEGVSDYLSHASEVAGADTPIVMAVDLADAISPKMVKARLKNLAAMQLHTQDIPAIEELIPKIKGVTFAVQMKDGFKGKIRVDFDGFTFPLKDVGKGILLEVLARHGLLIDDMNYWTATVSDKSLSLTGDIGAIGISNILNFHRTTASVGSMSNMAESMSRTASKSPEQIAAAASQTYFRAVKKSVDEVRTFKAQTMGQKATWNEKAARRIDDLPILNVDEMLLGYGSEVSGLLRSTGTEIRAANMSAGTAKAGQARTQYNGYGYGYGSGLSYNSANPAIAQANAQATERGMNTHLSNLKTIDELSAKIRAEMTKKYNVEF